MLKSIIFVYNVDKYNKMLTINASEINNINNINRHLILRR
jgi:hypothetical protein